MRESNSTLSSLTYCGRSHHAAAPVHTFYDITIDNNLIIVNLISIDRIALFIFVNILCAVRSKLFNDQTKFDFN